MFQIIGDYGVMIDEHAVNVGLVHTYDMMLPSDRNKVQNLLFDCGFYIGDDAQRGVVVDVVIPHYIKHPIIGISFKYGVGYAQLSFKKQGIRTARVFIVIHKRAFLEHYPTYSYASSMNGTDFMLEVLKKEPFKLLFFDINPPIKNSGLGLEIFNIKGEMVYDSDLPTVCFPPDIHRNADNYRSFVICQSFMPLYVIFNYDYPPLSIILDKNHAPLLFMGSRNHGFGEMSEIARNMNANYVNGNINALRIVDGLRATMRDMAMMASY